MSSTRGRSLLAHAVVMTTVVAHVVAFAATGGDARTWMTLTASLVPTVAVAAALARHRVHRATWSWVLAGLLLLVVHNAAGALGPTRGGDLAETVRTFAMPVAYLLILVAVVTLMLQANRHDPGAVVDAAIIALGTSLMLWVLVVDPLLDPDLADSTRIRTAVLLLACGGIGGALTQAVALVPHRRVSMLYIAATLVTSFAGVLARNLTVSPDQPRGAAWAQLLWVLSYAFVAGSVMHPSVSGTPRDDVRRARRLSRARIGLLGGALAVGPATALVQSAAPATRTPEIVVAVTTVAVVLLVVSRISGLARKHETALRRLEHLADHDELTGLPNRRTVHRHLDHLLDRVATGTAPGAVVLFVDLDDFKVVNDRHGHSVGDDLLRVVAERLRGTVRTGRRRRGATTGDLVARLAGDEFVVVLEADPDAADGAADRIRAALTGDVTVDGHVLRLRGTVGVAVTPRGERSTGDRMIGTADQRMYAAKRDARPPAAHERPVRFNADDSRPIGTP